MTELAARAFPPMMRLANRVTWPVRAFVVWAALGVLLTVLVVFIAGRGLGYERLAVMSGSMEPTVRTGDVVLSRHIEPSEARVGDVVTFRDPENAKRLITHRVRSVVSRGPMLHFVTKGDQNNSVERWRVEPDGRIGRAEYRVPKLGYVFAWIGGAWRKLVLLLLVPAVLLAAIELFQLWRPRREELE